MTQTAFKKSPPAKASGAPKKPRKSPLEHALESVGPELRQRIDEIVAWHRDETQRSLLGRYRLGVLVKEVYEDGEDQGGESRYGTMAMKKICHALPWCQSTLYEALKVAKAFSREEVEHFSQQHTAAGHFLSWTHLWLLAGQPKAVRKNLFKRVLAEDLAADQLHDEIQRLKGKADNRGRKPVPPRSLNGLMDQQRSYADHFLQRAQVWDGQHSLLGRVRDLAPEERTEKLLEELREHKEKLWQMAREAHAKAEEADRAYESLLGALERTRAHEEEAREDDDATEGAGSIGALCGAGAP
jgi:hypothetical protein